MTILLIGAGQLGSRHLQGLLKLHQKQIIYVVDPSTSSLSTTKQRADEIDHLHEVIYLTDWVSLPTKFDLSIIATNSTIREQLTTKLLEEYTVTYLILEKVLFQQPEAYERVSKLIQQKGTKTWVNHPRRMFKSYQEIRKIIQESNEPLTFHVTAGNLGLGCNGLHYIDLFSFLTDSVLENLDTDWLDDHILESKRQNFIEFTGTLKGNLKNNHYFTISSFRGESTPTTIAISSSSNRWLIQEGSISHITRLSKENGFKRSETTFDMEYQSTLSTKLASSLFTAQQCDLPTYEEASSAHVPFITALLKKYNQITGLNAKSCPIT